MCGERVCVCVCVYARSFPFDKRKIDVPIWFYMFKWKKDRMKEKPSDVWNFSIRFVSKAVGWYDFSKSVCCCYHTLRLVGLLFTFFAILIWHWMSINDKFSNGCAESQPISICIETKRDRQCLRSTCRVHNLLEVNRQSVSFERSQNVPILFTVSITYRKTVGATMPSIILVGNVFFFTSFFMCACVLWWFLAAALSIGFLQATKRETENEKQSACHVCRLWNA